MRHPDKHPEVIVQDQQPFNAESPLEPLRRGFVTPTELFYVRNHGSIPEADPGEHRVVVRALDSAADTQPESAGSIWNFKGYANNAWHRVSVNAQ